MANDTSPRRLGLVRRWQLAIRLSDVKATAKGGGLMLSTHAYNDGRPIRISLEQWAQETGFAASTIAEVAGILAGKGLLRRKRGGSGGKGGRGYATEYVLTIPAELEVMIEAVLAGKVSLWGTDKAAKLSSTRRNGSPPGAQKLSARESPAELRSVVVAPDEARATPETDEPGEPPIPASESPDVQAYLARREAERRARIVAMAGRSA